MAVGDIVPVGGARFEDTLESASPDLLREMIRGFAQRMMDAEVEGLCGAGYGEVSPDRVNSRNGYRPREQDTRAGTIELAIPKLRQGTYYPEWLLERRRRAGRGLAGVQLVTSDCHHGLRDAIAAVLPGASWQRCRAHYSRDLATRVPKSAQPWVATLVRAIFEQPDAASARAQHAQVVTSLEAKFPAAAEHLDDARDDILAFTAFPREVWR